MEPSPLASYHIFILDPPSGLLKLMYEAQASLQRLPTIVLIKLQASKSSEVMLLAHVRDVLHLLGRQLDLGDLGQIACHALLIPAGGYSYHPLVDAPPQSNLRLGHAVLLCQLRPDRVNRPAFSVDDRSKGGIAGHGNVVLPMEINKVAMLKIRVVLDLIDGGLDGGNFKDCLEVFLEEIGYPDGSSSSRFLDLFQVFPPLLELFLGVREPWPVDEVEVNVLEFKFLQRQRKGFLDAVLLLVRVDFGGDEELLSWHFGSFDGSAKLLLIVIT